MLYLTLFYFYLYKIYIYIHTIYNSKIYNLDTQKAPRNAKYMINMIDFMIYNQF